MSVVDKAFEELDEQSQREEDLDESQQSLFKKVLTRIKKEKVEVEKSCLDADEPQPGTSSGSSDQESQSILRRSSKDMSSDDAGDLDEPSETDSKELKSGSARISATAPEQPKSAILIDPMTMLKGRRRSSPRKTKDKKAEEENNESMTAKKFYRPPDPYESRLTKDEVKEIRKSKLREIAEREKAAKATESKEKGGTAKTSYAKSSVPKTQKLLEEDVPRPTRRSLRQKGEPEASTSTATINNGEKRQEEIILGSTPTANQDIQKPEDEKGPPSRAETVVDEDGNRRIAKMTFKNAISNIEDDDNSVSVAAQKPLSVLKSILKKKIPRTAKDKKVKGKVSWPDRTKGNKSLVQIREIEIEGKGRPVKSGRCFDSTASFILGKQQERQAQVPRDQHRFMSASAIMEQILTWQPVWLVEQEKQDQAPPVEGNRLRCCHVPSVFTNFKEYCNTFYPLMLHELWASVYKDYKELKAQCPVMLACVTNVVNDPQNRALVNLNVVAFISNREKRQGTFSEGWLCKIDLRYTDGRQEFFRPCFGYVTSVEITKKTDRDQDTFGSKFRGVLVQQRKDELRSGAFTIKLSFRIRRLHPGFNADKPIKIDFVSRIAPMMRLFYAVAAAEGQTLFQTLLRPHLSNFEISSDMDDISPVLQKIAAIRNLNEVQVKVVKSVSRMCSSGLPDVPHIALVQGPPGTGKTSTIVGIILQTFYKFKNFFKLENIPRIVVMAPSNAAIDEIGHRLLAVRNQVPNEESFNLMRIGKTNSKEIQTIQIDTLVEQNLERRLSSMSNTNSVNAEVQNRQRTLNILGDKLERAVLNENTDEQELLHRKIKEEQSYLNRAKNPSHGISEKRISQLRSEAKRDLFMFSQIVLVTLNSSYNSQMEHFSGFMENRDKTKRPFSIAIIDEAGQSVEPETLIPLRLRFKKLVMVGDPEQLPATVLSKKAKKLSYKFSLFGRLFKKFENEAENPTQMLQLQYRMHPEIAKWPNSYFYGGKISNGPQNRESCFRPYLLLDTYHEREHRSGPDLWNTGEARLIADLVKYITDVLRSKQMRASIGVITFYAKQRAQLQKEMDYRRIADKVTVRTVDAFQVWPNSQGQTRIRNLITFLLGLRKRYCGNKLRSKRERNWIRRRPREA